MEYTLECEQEGDGRWLAEVPQLVGVLAYGPTREEALTKAQVLALRILAKRIELKQARPHSVRMLMATA
jgi:predicted RNase H-like HicB family nuclease